MGIGRDLGFEYDMCKMHKDYLDMFIRYVKQCSMCGGKGDFLIHRATIAQDLSALTVS